MRLRELLLIVVAGGSTAVGARAQDTASVYGQPRMVGVSFLSGFTFGVGLGSTPDVAGGMGATADVHLGLSFSGLPGWTFGASVGQRLSPKTTGYVTSSGAHPTLESSAGGIQVQHRWRRATLIQPIASATVGTFDNYYRYTRLLTPYTYEERHVGYTDLAGGAEFVLRSWMRVATTGGLRLTHATMPNTSASGAGVIAKALLEFGVF